MAIRNGVDIVDVARLDRVLQRWPRMQDRIFTEAESVYASSRKRRVEHLAARFAAKEATFKALGTGWPYLPYSDVEVVSGDSGPQLALKGKAAHLLGQRTTSLSIAHDGGFAVAQVIIEGDKDAARR